MTHEHAATSRVGALDCETIVADERMIALMETATRAAACDAKVLITGESGVGKDLIARHLHKYSARSAYPFIAVNCAGLYGEIGGRTSFLISFEEQARVTHRQ